MSSDSYNISIVVIGYNTLSTLPNTINSINRLKVSNHNVEVIYIDDGSTDGSYEYFENTKLNFQKLNFCFKNNHGRVAARLKGIEMACGEWLLFLNSNIIVEENLLLEYVESISMNNAYAYGGSVNTISNDLIFQKYLNHPNRGINQYKNNQNINYQHLIFNNCMINKKIFNTITFNSKLRYYGGEELDFAYKMHEKHPNMMVASKNALATRINHPNYKKHLYRLIEFGETNFILLDSKLQIDIVRYKFLLNKNILFKALFNVLYFICILLYKLPLIGNHIVKIGLLASILRGYYKNKL